MLTRQTGEASKVHHTHLATVRDRISRLLNQHSLTQLADIVVNCTSKIRVPLADIPELKTQMIRVPLADIPELKIRDEFSSHSSRRHSRTETPDKFSSHSSRRHSRTETPDKFSSHSSRRHSRTENPDEFSSERSSRRHSRTENPDEFSSHSSRRHSRTENPDEFSSHSSRRHSRTENPDDLPSERSARSLSDRKVRSDDQKECRASRHNSDRINEYPSRRRSDEFDEPNRRHSDHKRSDERSPSRHNESDNRSTSRHNGSDKRSTSRHNESDNRPTSRHNERSEEINNDRSSDHQTGRVNELRLSRHNSERVGNNSSSFVVRQSDRANQESFSKPAHDRFDHRINETNGRPSVGHHRDIMPVTDEQKYLISNSVNHLTNHMPDLSLSQSSGQTHSRTTSDPPTGRNCPDVCVKQNYNSGVGVRKQERVRENMPARPVIPQVNNVQLLDPSLQRYATPAETAQRPPGPSQFNSLPCQQSRANYSVITQPHTDNPPWSQRSRQSGGHPAPFSQPHAVQARPSQPKPSRVKTPSQSASGSLQSPQEMSRLLANQPVWTPKLLSRVANVLENTLRTNSALAAMMREADSLDQGPAHERLSDQDALDAAYQMLSEHCAQLHAEKRVRMFKLVPTKQ
eukprot:684039_1